MHDVTKLPASHLSHASQIDSVECKLGLSCYDNISRVDGAGQDILDKLATLTEQSVPKRLVLDVEHG